MTTTDKSKHLTLVHNDLSGLLDSEADALPAGFNKVRFVQNCMCVLNDTKDIEKIEPLSIARTLLKGAFLGLDFFNRECYAIPFGGKMQFLADYRGEKKIVKKYSINPILDIYAKLVREGDDFEETIIGGKQSLNFKPLSFNDKSIIGAFAVVMFKDGSMMYEVMSIADIENTRKNYSKMARGQAWTNSFGEMAKKTVLKRLCKHIEIDFENVNQAREYEAASDTEFQRPQKQKAKSSLDEPINITPEPKAVEDDFYIEEGDSYDK